MLCRFPSITLQMLHIAWIDGILPKVLLQTSAHVAVLGDRHVLQHGCSGLARQCKQIP